MIKSVKYLIGFSIIISQFPALNDIKIECQSIDFGKKLLKIFYLLDTEGVSESTSMTGIFCRGSED
jgi:hypothetical protein